MKGVVLFNEYSFLIVLLLDLLKQNIFVTGRALGSPWIKTLQVQDFLSRLL